MAGAALQDKTRPPLPGANPFPAAWRPRRLVWLPPVRYRGRSFMTFDEAKDVLRAFHREGVRYALVGAMAMAAQGIVRATRDLDIFVSPDPENVERLKRALRSLFDDPNIDEISAEDLTGAYPAIEYIPPGGRFSIDIVTRLGTALRFEDIETEELTVDDFSIRVATPRMLWRMKRDTVRPQDRADAEAIRRGFKLDE